MLETYFAKHLFWVRCYGYIDLEEDRQVNGQCLNYGKCCGSLENNRGRGQLHLRGGGARKASESRSSQRGVPVFAPAPTCTLSAFWRQQPEGSFTNHIRSRLDSELSNGSHLTQSQSWGPAEAASLSGANTRGFLSHAREIEDTDTQEVSLRVEVKQAKEREENSFLSCRERGSGVDLPVLW